MKTVKLLFPSLLLLMFIFGSQQSLSQMDWPANSYSTGNIIKCIAGQGSTLWLGTMGGGLFKFNKVNGQSVVYNKTNSDIPDMEINDIKIDTAANIWVATNNGLAYFNGTLWRIYKTTNSGIPSNLVTSVDIDVFGNKWIGTNNGLAMLTGNTWTVYNTSNSGIPSNWVHAVRIKPTGSKWVGTDGGLGRFDGATWTVYNTSNSDIPSDIVNTVTFDGDIGVYAGTAGGFGYLAGAIWTIYTTSNSALPNNFVSSFAWDTEANLWIGTQKGIAKYLGGNFDLFNKSNSPISSDFVRSIFIDNDNTKWIGTDDSLNKFKDTVWTKYYINKTKLATNGISDMIVDGAGYLWFATINGLTSYNGATWKYYTASKNLMIRNLAFDINKNLWMSTNKGIAKLLGDSLVFFNTLNSGLPTDEIEFITFDVFNNLWAATMGGLVKYNWTTWTIYNTGNSAIPSDAVNYLKFQGNTLLWIGTMNGLASFDMLSWNVWNTGNSGIPGDMINSIQVDEAGRKWIGTNNGLSYFNDTTFVNYTTGNSRLPSNNVRSLLIDNNGNLFIGTLQGGLAFKQDTNWTIGNIDNSPLPVNAIFSLYKDMSNNIYISTPLGALVMNQSGITPTLNITSNPPSACGGNLFKVKFNNLFAFNANNIFTVELSDANGSFANPVVIGTKASTSPNGVDSINCIIPDNIQSGNGFRVRVRASLPAVLSADNGFNIHLVELPRPAISGRDIVCFDETTSYSTPWDNNVTYEWSAINGVIVSDSTTNVVSIHWSNSATTAQLKVVETNELGCKDSSLLDVAIYGHPRMIITGPNNVCSGKEYTYTADTSHNIRYWSAVGGKVLSIPVYNKVRVLWTATSENGRLKLVEVTPGGCEDSTFFDVLIQPTPTADIYGSDEVSEGSTQKYVTDITSQTITKKWYAINGEVIGANNKDTVIIKWPKGGFGAVLHSQKSTAGCLDSNALTVRIFENIDVEGIRNVCEQTEELYEANKNLGAYALWNVIGGTIVGSNTQRTCVIQWGNAGTGIIRLIQWVPNTSYRDTIDVNITINALPPKPTIKEGNDTLYSSADIGNQWYFNGAMIPGATGKIYFTNQIKGKYAVQVTASYKCVSPMSSDFDFVSAVNDDVASGELSVYPNPSDGIFTININNYSGNSLSYIVYDNLGTKLISGTYSLTGTESFKIDLSKFTSGVYHLNILDGNTSRQLKLILNK